LFEFDHHLVWFYLPFSTNLPENNIVKIQVLVV